MPKEREFYNLEAFWAHAERVELPESVVTGGLAIEIFGVCPVPSEQQPLNEYEELKASRFFVLAPQTSHIYHKARLDLGRLMAVAGPVAAASFVYKYRSVYPLWGRRSEVWGVTSTSETLFRLVLCVIA